MSFSGLPFPFPQGMTGAAPQSSPFGGPNTVMGVTPPGAPPPGGMMQPGGIGGAAPPTMGAPLGNSIMGLPAPGGQMSPLMHALMMQRLGIGPNMGGGNVMGVTPPGQGTPANPIMGAHPQQPGLNSSPFSMMHRIGLTP